MPSLTTWNRIEIDTRHQSLAEGLAARIHDPLWTLGRQWQMGEFRGVNGGSPLRVDVAQTAFKADRLRLCRRADLQFPDPNPDRSPNFDSRSVPLEALVEQDGVGELGHDVRLRARGGRYFVELLGKAQLAGLVPTLLAQHAFPAPAATDPEASLVRRVRGSSPDGKKLLTRLTSGDYAAFATQLGATQAQQPAFVALCDEWRKWYAPRAGVRSASTWNPEQVDYTFEMAVYGPAPERTPIASLQAREYAGGRLDWDAFHAVPTQDNAFGGFGGNQPRVNGPITSSSAVPTPVRFPGMPASRFWAMEDARVDLGNLDAGPGDIGRVLLAEFALLWANDWFVAPVPVAETGALVRLEGVSITDSFGVRRGLQRGNQMWSDYDFQLFRVAGPWFQNGQGLTEFLFVPPVVPASLQSSIEELTIVRDEAANLAWAIEKLVPGTLGRPARVTQASLPALASPDPGVVTGDAASVLRYEAMTPARPGWTPLAPVLATTQPPGVMLQRAEVVDPRSTSLPPQGMILAGDFRVRNEEVPREGLTLRRRYELARAQDGSLHLWISREKRPAAGEVASGLRFDFLTEVPAPPGTTP